MGEAMTRINAERGNDDSVPTWPKEFPDKIALLPMS